MERTTEELDLLKRLDIKDFRQLNKDHVLSMMSTLKNYPVEIQAKIIDQFPNITDFLNNGLEKCQNIIKDAMNSNDKETESIFKTYDLMVEEYINQLNHNDNLSQEQKIEIMNCIGDIAERKERCNDKNKEFKHQMVNKVLTAFGFCAGLALSAIGVNIGLKNNK